jgi:hypothetical protein
MATTYTLINSNVLSSSQASVTFSSIPATYTDLVLRISAQADSATNSFSNITITFNGTSTTNLGSTRLTGNGATVASNQGTNQGIIMPNVLPKTGVTGSPWCNAEVYIPSYTVAQNKPLSTYGVSEGNQTTAWIAATAGLFSDTTAISSIVLTGSTDFITGSSFYLYGISSN